MQIWREETERRFRREKSVVEEKEGKAKNCVGWVGEGLRRPEGYRYREVAVGSSPGRCVNRVLDLLVAAGTETCRVGEKRK